MATVAVGVGSLGVLGVGVAGQPLSAAFTAAISSLTATVPSPLVSNAGQVDSGELPSAMLTPRMSSLTSTLPPPLQSPGQAARAGLTAYNSAMSASLRMRRAERASLLDATARERS